MIISHYNGVYYCSINGTIRTAGLIQRAVVEQALFLFFTSKVNNNK